MKRLGMALILTCALSVSALAGDIPTIGKAGDVPTVGKAGDVPTAGAPAVPPPTTQSTTGSVATTILLTFLSLIR